MKLTDLQKNPNPFSEYYSQFRVAERLLLTGHSHQAWPDVAFQGVKQAYQDASEMVDNKWERAFEKADAVRNGFAELLDDEDGYIALGSNTHELVLRFLSALPLQEKPKLITSDGEFHTIRRQLARLEEEGIEVVRISSQPVEDIAEKLIAQLDDQVSAVLISSVFFDSGLINPGIKAIAKKCDKMGIALLVDSYHSLNVAPFSIRDLGLQNAFVTGGGYKYCQLGEGNCFLRFPQNYVGRPVITGWYSEFSLLARKHSGKIEYGERAALFAGSTYDPTSHYRAVQVFDFFRQMKLYPALLREISQYQIGLLVDEFNKLDMPEKIIKIDNKIPMQSRAGFLVLNSEFAGDIQQKLERVGVLADHRGNSLRLGPAPYLSDQQLKDAMDLLGEVVRKL